MPKPEQLTIKYQQVFHLNPENLVSYDGMTYPSLQIRWQTQPPRGELLGISASVSGEMVGLAVAEHFAQANSEQAAELISLFVLPAYRHQGIGSTLVRHLQKFIGKPLAGQSLNSLS